jgi:hypothetical protein
VRSVWASTTSVSPNKCARVKQTPLTTSGAEAFGQRSTTVVPVENS